MLHLLQAATECDAPTTWQDVLEVVAWGLAIAAVIWAMNR